MQTLATIGDFSPRIYAGSNAASWGHITNTREKNNAAGRLNPATVTTAAQLQTRFFH
jgi:hypothetical protein